MMYLLAKLAVHNLRELQTSDSLVLLDRLLLHLDRLPDDGRRLAPSCLD
jgi:hypothetical protein